MVMIPVDVLVTEKHRKSCRKVIVEAPTGCRCNIVDGMDYIAWFWSSSTKRD